MKKNNVKSEYLKKIKQLHKFNKAYFKKDNPLVSDEKYDNLKLEVLDIEKKYPFLKNDLSPSSAIGFEPFKLETLIGKKLKCDVNEDQPIEPKMII